MNNILVMGELLIDFIPCEKGRALKDVDNFQRATGGAPGNVAAAISKLGGHSIMISKLGYDAFGDHIVENLNRAGVDTKYVFRTNEAKTALAFVSLDKEGNRDFSFYRNPSADLFLSPDDITEDMFDNCSVFHFGSVDLVDYPVKKAHKRAIEIAKAKGITVSFDPNIRLPLWDSPEACQAAVREFLPYADIVKISDNELEFITGKDDPAEAAKLLFENGCKFFMYTKGNDGAEAFTKNVHVSMPCFPVEVVDTTGAGDSFMGSMLYSITEKGMSLEGLENIDENTLKEFVKFSSLYAASTTTRKGGACSMATMSEIKEFAKRF